MPRGGARKGAGRKVGIPNRDKREVIAKAEALGLMPIDVMLENMKFYHDGTQALTEKLEEVARDISSQDFIDGNECVDKLFKLLDKVTLFRDRAQSAASDAAPYIHPRLAAIAVADNPESEAYKAITEKMAPKEAASVYLALLAGR